MIPLSMKSDYTHSREEESMASEKEIIESVSKKRQEKVGGYLIREQRRVAMEKAIESGLHFVDAAAKADIPYEVAMSAVSSDPEFSQWYKISRQRPKLENIQKKRGKPKTSLQIKSDFINKLSDVGLFDKIAVMAEQADPETDEGKQVLGFFMRYVVKDILPKETAAKIEHSDKASYDQLTDAELLETLQKRRQERIELTQEIRDADQKRLSHTQEYVEEIQDYEAENEGEAEQGTTT